MVKSKVREKGKVRLSMYFQEFGKGESVAVVRERSIMVNFPQRIQGRTGVIEGKRGRSYLVKIKTNKNEKIHIIQPIHLKKIKQIKKNDK